MQTSTIQVAACLPSVKSFLTRTATLFAPLKTLPLPDKKFNMASGSNVLTLGIVKPGPRFGLLPVAALR